MDLYAKLDQFTPDNLIAGNEEKIIVKGITLAKNQGVVKRGTVLGKVLLAAGAIAADAGNTGDAAIDSATLAANVQQGIYTVECITAPSGAGANDAVFAVFAPDGSRLGDATQGVEYAGGHLVFTVGNAVAADSVLGDIYTITVDAGSGIAKVVDSTAVDGSQTAFCILTDDIDTGDADAEDVATTGYFSGVFNKNALTFGGADTAVDHEDKLRELGIFLKENEA